ncbi:MAG TPA: DUF5667 domain-containing protein [Patescibacteria group bacterium]|nr:DUF5667 domain-containing protein [Patescibacteria group bacterium]
MSRATKDKLRRIKNYKGQINPDQSWVTENRGQLMSQISNTVSRQTSPVNFAVLWQAINILAPGRMAYSVVRPVAVFVLVIMVTASGWIASVGATQNCLPGEICYGVKMATEKTQEIVFSVTNGNKEEAQLALEFASRRATEVKMVVEKNETDAPKKAAVAVKKMEASIDTANQKIKQAGEEDPSAMVQVTKDVNEKAKEIENTLKEVEDRVGGTEADVAVAKQKVKEATLTAVEAVITGQESGKTDVPAEEVKNLLQEQIDQIISDTTAVTGRVQDLKQTVQNTAVTSSMSGLTGGTVNEAGQATATTTLINEASITVQKVSQSNQDAVVVLNEAKELVDTNRLGEAVQKVKEATQVSVEATRSVIEAQKVVEEAVKIVEAAEQAAGQNVTSTTSSTILMNSSTVVNVTGTVPGEIK